MEGQKQPNHTCGLRKERRVYFVLFRTVELDYVSGRTEPCLLFVLPAENHDGDDLACLSTLIGAPGRKCYGLLR